MLIRRPPLTPPASTRLHPLSVRASSVTLSPSVSPRSPARLTDASQNWERDDGVEWRTANVPRRRLRRNAYTAIAGPDPGRCKPPARVTVIEIINRVLFHFGAKANIRDQTAPFESATATIQVAPRSADTAHAVHTSAQQRPGVMAASASSFIRHDGERGSSFFFT
ncbi:unnamed protein product [Arctogadus glacialis]